jgi:5-methylcytosine-specific restriction endonuclease McrA
MASKTVRVELGPNGLPCRIFRDKSWRDLPEESVRKMDKAAAVGAIRAQVFDRASGEDGDYTECERCGRRITWDGFEMNEKLPKGSGGEVSLKNCEALCHACHQGGPDSAHGDRRWQTSKLSPEGQNGH